MAGKIKKKELFVPTLLSDYDIYLFKEGENFRLYDKLGAHVINVNGADGVFFAVWAPNAKKVSVVGDFNNWEINRHPLQVRWDSSGIWEGFFPDLKSGMMYKYYIESNYNGYKAFKADPFAFFSEIPHKTASIVRSLDYQWNDTEWMQRRKKYNHFDSPMAIYEVHLGSWKKRADGTSLSYRELANELVHYVKKMNFTHIQLMPILEHPFYGSWGYQVTGYFSATSRYGTPQDLMYLIDEMHINGIGVILDWVPAHFPTDEFSLRFFDGTCLYEHEDPRKGFHPDWNSAIFNLERYEVKEFLISSAFFWLDKYHVDGLRIDAVSSMLYLDYSRKEGEWAPNKFGGRENLEAIDFFKELNKTVYANFPDVQVIAEESTAWPMVTKPVHTGGLGFGLKWNMGWMHDTLEYFSKDPVYRKYHQNLLTFSLLYAFSENFMLVVSHDEVVHGKGSLYSRMPGDEWQKNANLRAFLGYMYGHSGKKLIFMGTEFGQKSEWNHDAGLEWYVLDFPEHIGIQNFVRDLNAFYLKHPALYENDFSVEGFEWIDCSDFENSTLSFIRKSKEHNDKILVICNFTPVARKNYLVGVSEEGKYQEMLNSDDLLYGGSGIKNSKINFVNKPMHNRPFSLELDLPPLGVVFVKKVETAP